MKIIVALLGFALLALFGPVSPAHAAATPTYTCVIVNLGEDGTLTGAYCQGTDGAPAQGPILEPFAVWSPFQLTRIILCTSGEADTPTGITGYGCQRLF
ncbi:MULTISPECIES: hypothetical protein [unclassified Nonomuraea]|uniref:hypothetical protein n=1 Tax=Nonomuraea sp. NPDC003804 TaxID=3154547 RepID=UPI0033B948D9